MVRVLASILSMVCASPSLDTKIPLDPRPKDAVVSSEDSSAINAKMWDPVRGPHLAYESFQIDMRDYDLGKVLIESGNAITVDPESTETKRLKQRLSEVYETVGVAHLVNTPMTRGGEFKALTKMLFGSEDNDYTGGSNLREPISKNVGENKITGVLPELEENVFDTGVPGAAAIHYHHEMEYMDTSCEWISFGCIDGTRDAMKGASYISDSSAATDMMLKSALGKKLVQKGVCVVKKYPDQHLFTGDPDLIRNYWQTSCNTEDADEAAEIMRKRGLQVSWENSTIFGKQMVTKYCTSAFEYDPSTRRNTLFTSVSQDYVWFDSWPKIKDLPHYEKPTKLTFGDGEAFAREEKQFFADCYGQFGTPIAWEKGDLAIINNRRYLHGRPAYDLENGEKRSIAVIIGPVFHRRGPLGDIQL